MPSQQDLERLQSARTALLDAAACEDVPRDIPTPVPGGVESASASSARTSHLEALKAGIDRLHAQRAKTAHTPPSTPSLPQNTAENTGSHPIGCEGVARPKHSPSCSNQNVLDPEGAFKGVEECGCASYPPHTPLTPQNTAEKPPSHPIGTLQQGEADLAALIEWVEEHFEGVVGASWSHCIYDGLPAGSDAQRYMYASWVTNTVDEMRQRFEDLLKEATGCRKRLYWRYSDRITSGERYRTRLAVPELRVRLHDMEGL